MEKKRCSNVTEIPSPLLPVNYGTPDTRTLNKGTAVLTRRAHTTPALARPAPAEPASQDASAGSGRTQAQRLRHGTARGGPSPLCLPRHDNPTRRRPRGPTTRGGGGSHPPPRGGMRIPRGWRDGTGGQRRHLPVCAAGGGGRSSGSTSSQAAPRRGPPAPMGGSHLPARGSRLPSAAAAAQVEGTGGRSGEGRAGQGGGGAGRGCSHGGTPTGRRVGVCGGVVGPARAGGRCCRRPRLPAVAPSPRRGMSSAAPLGAFADEHLSLEATVRRGWDAVIHPPLFFFSEEAEGQGAASLGVLMSDFSHYFTLNSLFEHGKRLWSLHP